MGLGIQSAGIQAPKNTQIHQANVASQEAINKLLEGAKETVKDTMEALRSGMTEGIHSETSVIDDKEAGSVNKRQLGRKSDDIESAHHNLVQKDMAQKSRSVREMGQAQLGLGLAQEIEKKTRKKTKLEETIEELAALEGLMDLEALSEAEKKELEEFFNNVSRLKKMKSKLNYLEEQEEIEEEKLRQQEERERRKKQKEAQLQEESEEGNSHHG